jgi:uncharacterized membrane protein
MAISVCKTTKVGVVKTMKQIIALMFGLLLMVSLAANVAASAVPVTVEKVEVDGFALDAGGVNPRDLQRGESFDVKILVKADNAIVAPNNETMNVQVFGFISGYEFSSSESLSDETRAFDLEAGHTAIKTLTLKLPERADEDTYRLRIVVAGRNNDERVYNYAIKVQPADTKVTIRDLELSPGDEIQAGRAFLATVRIKNYGDSRENDVKIRVSIPELGIAAPADFVDDLRSDESATSEEFFLKTESCTKPGSYTLKAEVIYDQGDESTTLTRPITVTAGNCDAPVSGPSGKTTISFSAESQDVVEGSVATYPVTITNGESSARVFMLAVDGADEWATVRVSPSGVVSVKPGETKTAFVFVTPKDDVAAGQRVFAVHVKDAAGNSLQDLALKANVVADSEPAVGGSLKGVASVVLVVLVALLVLIGLVLAFRRSRGPEGEESQTYY